jgi:hypothetical protein
VTTPRVTKEHFVDHGESDADGSYDYHYAYWDYDIDVDDRHYGARVYDDEPGIAVVHTAPSPRPADRNLDDLALVLEVLRTAGLPKSRCSVEAVATTASSLNRRRQEELVPDPRACAAIRSQNRQLRMEPLWSRAVATRGNRRQIGQPQKRRKPAKTVAVGCDQVPAAFDGKEGSAVRVRQRACTKDLQIGILCCR